MFVISSDLMHNNLRVLQMRAQREAIQGVLIAAGAIVVATVMVSLFQRGEVSLDGLIQAQTSNIALWMLDALAFVFPIWGQYASRIIAYEAGAIVQSQTEALRVRNDQLEREKTFATTHDPVTELPNRALFYDRVEQAIRSHHGKSGQLVILVLAIENLTEIQDTLGPAAADLLLRQLSSRLKGCMQRNDSVARLDSRSFGVLPEASMNKEAAEQIAHQLQRLLEPPFDIQRLKLSLHTSIAVVFSPDHGDDPDTLVQRAGVALHVASRAHNGFAFYSPSLDEHSPRRLTLMGELRQAIERDQLELYYQPKADLASGRIVGLEALVRWPHPRHGLIPPDEFIGMAERTRMIKPLTQWVMERAFSDSRLFRDAGYDLSVAINLSAVDLHDPELPDRILGVMTRTGLAPGHLIFEITESSIIADPDRVLNVLERIHALGFTLSIDDFGTGYSSLAYLKRLPVSELKIDRSFVQDMLSSENDAVIVRATIELAHNLGLSVTAEGVSTVEAFDWLREHRCDTAQGYYLNRPVDRASLLEWFETSGWQVRRFGAEPITPEA